LVSIVPGIFLDSGTIIAAERNDFNIGCHTKGLAQKSDADPRARNGDC
jgi:hypothetical protein